MGSSGSEVGLIPLGAKASFVLASITARLKPCPFKAGTWSELPSSVVWSTMAIVTTLALFQFHRSVLLVANDAVGALRIADGHQFRDDLGNRIRFRTYGAGARAAAKRTQAAGDPLLFSGEALNEWLFEGMRESARTSICAAWRNRAGRWEFFRDGCSARCRVRSNWRGGKTRMLSPGPMRPLKRLQIQAVDFWDPIVPISRKEKIRSLARISSSRRAPPGCVETVNAEAVKEGLSLGRPQQRRVPSLIGLAPPSRASSLRETISSRPSSAV